MIHKKFLDIQKKIKKDIELLISLIPKNKTINIGVAQKTAEQRISQDIETHINKTILDIFSFYKKKFLYLKNIKKNNGSPKAPYELLLIFYFSSFQKEVYLDLKPINVVKKNSSPFMGTINKYVNRIITGNYYDLYFVISYESNVDKLPIIKDINFYFVKDITNFTLYKNWQLQITIKKIKEEFGITPAEYVNSLKKLLFKLKEQTEKIKNDCDKKIKKLENWKQ